MHLPLSRQRTWGAAAGLALERYWGPLRLEPHPVLVHRRAVELVASTAGGAEAAARGILGVASAVAAGRSIGSTIVGVGLASSAAGFRREIVSVGQSLDQDDLESARHRLQPLTAWDVSAAGSGELVAVAIESIAEASIDTAVAPAVTGAVAGAPAALTYRAAAGLRTGDPGDLNGRVADVLHAVPEVVGVLAVMATRPRAAGEILDGVQQARSRPGHKPGALITAAFASSLGVRLGGKRSLDGEVISMPAVGGGRRPGVQHLWRAVRIADRVTLVTVAGLGAVGWLAGRGGR